MRSYHYTGRCVRSALWLPELPLFDDADGAVHGLVQVRISRTMPMPPKSGVRSRHNWRDGDGNICILGEYWDDGRYCLRFPDIATAVSSPDGLEIALHAHQGASRESVRHALLDHVLPRALALAGEPVLHGSAVATPGGRHLVLLGDSGRGKSTLATGFDLHGGNAVADDCMTLAVGDDGVLATPTYSGLRLWPDSLDTLLAHRRGEAGPVAHYSDKQRIPAAILSQPMPQCVDAFLLLQPPRDKATASDPVQLQPLPPGSACMALVANSFLMDPTAPAHLRRQLDHAARICKHVPVYGLQYPRDYNALPRVVAEIAQAFDARAAAS